MIEAPSESLDPQIFSSFKLLEVYDVAPGLDLRHGKADVHILHDWALAPLDLDFLACGEQDVFCIGLAEDALELAAVGGEDLHLFAHVVLPLAQHLEGLSQATPSAWSISTVMQLSGVTVRSVRK